MQPTTIEILATTLFAIAVLHTFLSSRFQHLAHKFPKGSIGENLFHLLGEVEVVFGLWAGIFVVTAGFMVGQSEAVSYVEGLNFTEPLFVFAIMTVAATRPVINLTRSLILGFARILPIPLSVAAYFSALVVGPLLGSFITEPAAMTVTAFILGSLYFNRDLSKPVKYITLAVLLVNISIGGVLTHFAAPPVLMVAAKWNWDTPFMLENFGWRAVVTVLINAALATAFAFKELRKIHFKPDDLKSVTVPHWLTFVHLVFLGLIVFYAHHVVIFVGLVLFFLGVATITAQFQDSLKIREALLVSYFLGGLVVLGGLQKWWLQPVIESLDASALFFGATALTAITDNAALTYLGAQVDGVSDLFKYALVAGAVSGGGLTVIANAPNPVAFSVLQSKFGPDGIGPLPLLLSALIPTGVAVVMFWFLR